MVLEGNAGLNECSLGALNWPIYMCPSTSLKHLTVWWLDTEVNCPAAAAAAKSLQSCPTLCDPIDGSPPGSAVPEILQARTLEWVAISFSNAWKWKVGKWSHWVVSNSQRPHGLQPTRLLRPWDFPGKSIGVGCHCLLRNCPRSQHSQREKAESATHLKNSLHLAQCAISTTLYSWARFKQRRKQAHCSMRTMRTNLQLTWIQQVQEIN